MSHLHKVNQKLVGDVTAIVKVGPVTVKLFHLHKVGMEIVSIIVDAMQSQLKTALWLKKG
jgi:hypothetical protein